MRIGSLLLTASLLVAACGVDAASTTRAGVDSTIEVTTIAPGPTTPGTVGVVVDGVRWELPAAVCAQAPGDADAVAAAADTAAAEVRALVADRASGWPTTTAAPPGESATFFVAVNRAGPTALALGTLQATIDEIVAAWSEFELGYAELAGSFGPVTDISNRLAGWRITADAIVAAVPEACG